MSKYIALPALVACKLQYVVFVSQLIGQYNDFVVFLHVSQQDGGCMLLRSGLQLQFSSVAALWFAAAPAFYALSHIVSWLDGAAPTADRCVSSSLVCLGTAAG